MLSKPARFRDIEAERIQQLTMKKTKAGLRVLLACCVGALVLRAYGEEANAKLWYNKPAINWEKEALPIGNGRLGGMIFWRR